MTIQSNVSISSSKVIDYIGPAHGMEGAEYYSVYGAHIFLQGLAWQGQASGDDLIDISRQNPSSKQYYTIISIINGYTMTDTLIEHLYEGSIIQNDGDDIWDGIKNNGTPGVHIEILQNGALIANDFWNSVPFGETLKGLNRDDAQGITHNFLLKVRDGGVDIDGRRIIGLSREFNYTYRESKINGTNRGNNILFLEQVPDTSNTTAASTVSGWAGDIVNVEGYADIDANDDDIMEHFYSKWTRGTHVINHLYEFFKWATRRGSASTLYGLNGGIFRGITHEIVVDTPTGTFEAVEPVSWPSGTGQMLAINHATNPTKMWIQLLTGIPPVNNQVITGGTSGATCAMNVTITERTITVAGSSPFRSTVASISGAYGFGILATDLSAADKLVDLDNAELTPPNYVTFVVDNTEVGDRILVGPAGAVEFQEDQLSASGAYSGGETTFTVVEDIPVDTPASGTIRVKSGTIFVIVGYTGWSGKSFTGCTNVPATLNNADVWISYMDRTADADSESFSTISSGSPRPLFVKVINAGVNPIKEFVSVATLSITGGSINVVRNSDG